MRVEVDSLSAETDVVYVVGDVSRAEGSRLHRLAARSASTGRRVLVDLTHVSFLDSAGVSAVTALWRALRADRTPAAFVVPDDSPAARTLGIARVTSMLGLVATVEQGLHAVRA